MWTILTNTLTKFSSTENCINILKYAVINCLLLVYMHSLNHSKMCIDFLFSIKNQRSWIYLIYDFITFLPLFFTHHCFRGKLYIGFDKFMWLKPERFLIVYFTACFSFLLIPHCYFSVGCNTNII